MKPNARSLTSEELKRMNEELEEGTKSISSITDLTNLIDQFQSLSPKEQREFLREVDYEEIMKDEIRENVCLYNYDDDSLWNAMSPRGQRDILNLEQDDLYEQFLVAHKTDQEEFLESISAHEDILFLFVNAIFKDIDTWQKLVFFLNDDQSKELNKWLKFYNKDKLC